MNSPIYSYDELNEAFAKRAKRLEEEEIHQLSKELYINAINTNATQRCTDDKKDEYKEYYIEILEWCIFQAEVFVKEFSKRKNNE